jgi:hypothetical protein
MSNNTFTEHRVQVQPKRPSEYSRWCLKSTLFNSIDWDITSSPHQRPQLLKDQYIIYSLKSAAAFDQGYTLMALIMNHPFPTEAGKGSAPSARTFPRATSRMSTIQFGAKGASPRSMSWWMKSFAPIVAQDVGRGKVFAYGSMI